MNSHFVVVFRDKQMNFCDTDRENVTLAQYWSPLTPEKHNSENMSQRAIITSLESRNCMMYEGPQSPH